VSRGGATSDNKSDSSRGTSEKVAPASAIAALALIAYQRL
jgi:hypothetical protein